MHIGYLTPEYVTPRRPEGGLANYLQKAAWGVAARGHRVTVLVLSDRAASWKDGPVSVCEVPWVRLPAVLGKNRRGAQLLPVIRQALSCQRLARAVWQLHRHEPFDILQASSYMAPGFALRGNRKVPVVCRVSSYSPMVRSAYGRRRAFAEYLSDWLEIRQVLDATDAFAPSEFVARVFERLEAYRPRVLRTPVEWVAPVAQDETFYQQHLSQFRYLLFFGTLSRIKGVDLLAEALPPVLARHGDLRAVFIGRDDGMPGHARAYDHIRARAGGVGDRVLYQPAMPKAQLWPVIAHALGVLMPSRVDNYPNACLEAQCLGVPVIGTTESSLEEMISDGETGFLARNGDAESVRDAIERLLALTPEQRRQMQERIQAAMAAIRAEDRIGQLLAFYAEAIARFRRTRAD